MNDSTQTSWRSRVLFTSIAGALAIGAVMALPSPASAYWVGFPFPGYYPGSYYGYYPPPPYYAPPPAYYPPAYAPSYPPPPAYGYGLPPGYYPPPPPAQPGYYPQQ